MIIPLNQLAVIAGCYNKFKNKYIYKDNCNISFDVGVKIGYKLGI